MPTTLRSIASRAQRFITGPVGRGPLSQFLARLVLDAISGKAGLVWPGNAAWPPSDGSDTIAINPYPGSKSVKLGGIVD
jgi:hypothetical protein